MNDARPLHRGHDPLFVAGLSSLLAAYVALILALLAALASFTSASDVLRAFQSEEIRYAFRLSLVSCTLSTLLCLWVAVPAGYLLARFEFPGKNWIDALLDIPIVLPPLVIGLALLPVVRSRVYQKPA